jgi:DNA-binding response OmpR family regulator
VAGRICLVDHDLASRGYIRECLERVGHQVVVLDNGFQIKPLSSTEKFNVFILNIDAPGVRERELLHDIRITFRSRILLMVSARADAFLKEAIDLGVYGFIHQPFDRQEVCTLVDHLTRS